MKRIVLLMAAAAVVAAMVAVSALSASAQETPGQVEFCAPWSKEWDISQGWWWFQWYRWCYNPSVEGGWVTQWGSWEWWAPVEVD